MRPKQKDIDEYYDFSKWNDKDLFMAAHDILESIQPDRRQEAKAEYDKRQKAMRDAIRATALDEAITAQCYRCREGQPVERCAESYIHPNLTPCYASEIHGLKEKPNEQNYTGNLDAFQGR